MCINMFILNVRSVWFRMFLGVYWNCTSCRIRVSFYTEGSTLFYISVGEFWMYDMCVFEACSDLQNIIQCWCKKQLGFIANYVLNVQGAQLQCLWKLNESFVYLKNEIYYVKIILQSCVCYICICFNAAVHSHHESECYVWSWGFIISHCNIDFK